MKSRDGLIDLEDLAAHNADWVEPISTNYRGYDVLEMPPSTQGFVALEMLNLMEGFDVKAMGHNSADYLHLVAETKKIAFADRAAYLADRGSMPKGALADADLEGVRGEAAAGDRHAEGGRELSGGRARRRRRRRAGRLRRPRSRRHHLHDGRRRRRATSSR